VVRVGVGVGVVLGVGVRDGVTDGVGVCEGVVLGCAGVGLADMVGMSVVSSPVVAVDTQPSNAKTPM